MIEPISIDRQGWQHVPADQPVCECGCTCQKCGLLAQQDRDAAIEYGRRQGVIEGRLHNISEDLVAVQDAAALLGWVASRAAWAATDGEATAETFTSRPTTHQEGAA